MVKEFTEIDLISSAEGCRLYKTPQTRVEAGILKYICSEREGKIAFHRKLKVYKSKSGFYVIVHDTKCYIDNLMHKWFFK